MSQSKRKSTRRQEPVRGRMTERDIQILVSVYTYRYLSTSQVQTLLFGSVGRARSRLLFLSSNRYLRKFKTPYSSEAIYCLASRAVELVTERLGVEQLDGSLKRKPPKSSIFMPHFLECSWFRIWLEKEVVNHPQVEYLGFIPEWLNQKKLDGKVAKKFLREVVMSKRRPGREKLSHTPDGVFALRSGGENPRSVLFFLEVDRGTEVISKPKKGVLKSLLYYEALFSDKSNLEKYSRELGVRRLKAAGVLFLTNKEPRIHNVYEVAKDLSFPSSCFLWLGHTKMLEDGTLGQRVWKSVWGPREKLMGIFG